MIRRTIRSIGVAIRRHPGTFAGVAGAVLLLQIVLPPLVLSIVRKPVDFYTFNPWLSRLPEYLMSPAVPLARKLAFLPGLALFWCSADSGFGAAEWGFAVDVTDAGRFLLTALLIGTYFALWRQRRDQVAGAGWGLHLGRHGGVAGAFAGVLGLSTSPCSVVGCGAPMLPVVGLAFAGLSSTTLGALAHVSTAATAVVLIGMTAGVVYLGWLTGDDARAKRPLPPGGTLRNPSTLA